MSLTSWPSTSRRAELTLTFWKLPRSLGAGSFDHPIRLPGVSLTKFTSSRHAHDCISHEFFGLRMVALKFSVDRCAGDVEELGQLSLGVSSSLMRGKQMPAL